METQHKDIKYIKIIQKFIKKYVLKNNVKIKSIIISIKYVPQKNENKFIYGKLIEKSLIKALIKIGYDTIDLDKNHNIGSEYRNDIKLLNIYFSIKCKLNKDGNIILINKNSTNIHKYKKVCIIMCDK